MDDEEFGELAELWLTRLRSQGKAHNTINAYTSAVNRYREWSKLNHPDEVRLDRPAVEAFTADALAAGLDPATAELRCTALRSLSGYLAAEAVTDGDLLAGLKSPKRTGKVVPKLRDGELAALLAACKGTRFADRRDTAMVRLMAETGLRADELLSADLGDLDLKAGEYTVRKGKGGRGRTVPFGGKTGEALGWYLRARRTHPRASRTDALWLSHIGRLTYAGLHTIMGRRAQAAGIDGFHLHRLRHSFASQWLDAGGSEGGLMQIAGWRSRKMLDRYVEDTARARAIEEAKRLHLGDT